MTRFIIMSINLLCFSLVLCGLMGCGDSSDGQNGTGKMKIGFVQTGAESSWRTAQTHSIRSSLEGEGYQVLFFDAQGRPENQIRAFRGFIAQNVDLIVLSPIVDTGWTPVFNEAKQAKIPVFLVSRGVDVAEDLYVTKIAADFINEGRLAAKWLAEKTEGKANIIELSGTPGSDAARDRREGFAKGIQAHPGMKITASQSGQFTRMMGREVMEALLKVHEGKFDAVYAHNDDMALGAILAIEAAGLKPGKDILVVSIDAVKGAFEAMVKSTLNCTIECPALHGPYIVDAIDRMNLGESLPKHIVVKATTFDQSVAKDLIEGRQY